ncbi:MAG: hypothetical protein ABIR24_11250 [Verrucomicrobiota bacterium]
MNSDDFEKRLERQTIRPIPGEWRRDILQQAKGISPSPLKTQNSKLQTFLSELLWPCPQAWAGLAAVWLVILVFNSSTNEKSPANAQKTSPRSLETLMALRQQRWIFAELTEPRKVPVADRPKPFQPRPRSESRQEFLTA